MTGIRVVGGDFRGRRLIVPAGVRPTSNRAREALFDLLGGSVTGARFLDLYAGSGAIGVEALSRGAASATAVDPRTAVLERNAGVASGRLEIIRATAGVAIESLRGSGRRFEIVFGDPPYGPAADAGPEESASVLAPDGLLIWQTDAKSTLDAPPGMCVRRRAEYGRNIFHFFARSQ